MGTTTATTPLQSPSRRRRRCKCRLYCIFHEVSFAEFGTARVRGRRSGGGERRYSRVIKGSPGRTDAKINKPAVMNEAGSLESSQIYSVLIVTEIRASPSGQIC